MSRQLAHNKKIKITEKVDNHVHQYFAVCKSEVGPVARYFCHIRLFFSWIFRLLLPDFIVGHPNLFDNIKLLLAEKKFKPLRSAFFIWFVFTIIFVFAGLNWLKRAPSVDTSLGSWVQNNWSHDKATSSTYESINNLVIGKDGTISLAKSNDWFDIAWNYRRTVTFDFDEVTDADYLLIDIPYMAGMQEDFSDIRFVDVEHKQLSTQVVENKSNENATFAIPIDDEIVIGGTNTFFVYYGNSAAEVLVPYNDKGYLVQEVSVHIAEQPEQSIVDQGTLISEVFDNKILFVGQWGIISIAQGGSGEIRAKVRTSKDANMESVPDFIDCPSVGDGEDISTNPCVKDGEQFIQYQLIFVPQFGMSPVLKQVRIDYGDVNFSPDKPKNLGPLSELAENSVAKNPVLSASSFHDPNIGDKHMVTRWKVDNDPEFKSPEWIRVSERAEEFTRIDSKQGRFGGDSAETQSLSADTTYYWRVQYQDSSGAVSLFSEHTSFHTGETLENTVVVAFSPEDSNIILPGKEEREEVRTRAIELYTQGLFGSTEGDLHLQMEQVVSKVDEISVAIELGSQSNATIHQEFEESKKLIVLMEESVEIGTADLGFSTFGPPMKKLSLKSGLVIIVLGGGILFNVVLLSLWHHQLQEIGFAAGISKKQLAYLSKKKSKKATTRKTSKIKAKRKRKKNK